jgi:hypothetical protein
MQVFAPGVAGACAQAATTSDRAHSYDTADRITDAGYTYDAFGRTTSTGVVSTSYYVNDLVAGQVEGNLRRSWTAYPDQRIRAASSEQLSGGVWSPTGSSVHHYGDDTDEPRWIVDSGVTSRYISGPDGDLTAISTGGSTRLQLVNLHGDVVASTDPALVAPEFYRYDEFGVAAQGQGDRRRAGRHHPYGGTPLQSAPRPVPPGRPGRRWQRHRVRLLLR